MRNQSFHNSFSRSIHQPMMQGLGDGHNALQRYNGGLETMPPTGGYGGHRGIYVQALRGKTAGLSPEKVVADIREHLDDSRRPVDDRELLSSVYNAYGAEARESVPNVEFNRSMFEAYAARGAGKKVESPLAIPALDEQSCYFIKAMFRPDEYIVDGSAYAILAQKVMARLGSRRNLGPYIAINPFTGQHVLNENGNPSYRRDQFVSRFTYALGEFDKFPDTLEDIPKEQQLAVWAASGLRIAALIDSGGKSIHAWIVVNCADKMEWDQQVKKELFGKLLVPLGMDRACSNPSRFSRLPGVPRDENWQRLIYFAGPEGGVL